MAAKKKDSSFFEPKLKLKRRFKEKPLRGKKKLGPKDAPVKRK